ncbi:hypothetical protein, partial [Marinibacterium profundimaris]|uniref:hypothetical protein n=1 Tax=Marinibacterium profundimaris TaxID=1679460 RepID=UPI001E3B4C25
MVVLLLVGLRRNIMFAGMSEDDGNQSVGRGKKFPATPADASRNKVVSISDLRRLSHKEANDFVSRSVINHWPQYRIDYYKEVLLRYSERNSVSPQTLYDQMVIPPFLRGLGRRVH